jgi:tetratricopeptide (TPR) repeat protein
MAVDKNKIIAEATKLVQKGAYDKAIATYQKILAEDPKDVRVLLKVGELQQKKGDDRAAAQAFEKVAETYAEQGFFLKSVAVYKQIVKLDPDDVRVNERLAALYQQLGLMSDAMSQYQFMAAAYEKAGDGAKLTDVLKRMVELDPDNIASSIKLGELYARAGQPHPALECFRRAASYLKKHNRADEYLKVSERLASLSPEDLGLTRELAHIYLAKGDTKRALAKLQLCFKADPKDVETLQLLAHAFRDLGQTSKTISVFKELARVHEERGRAQEARTVWRKVQEIAPDDEDAAAALGSATSAGPHPAAAARAAPPHGPPPGASRAPPPGPSPGAGRAAPPAPPRVPPPAGGPEAIGKLLTETDVYVKYGLHDKALDHLRKVIALDTRCAEAHEKAREIHVAAGRTQEAAAAGALAARALLDRAQLDRARDAVMRLRQIAPDYPELAALNAAVGGTEEVDLVDEMEDEEEEIVLSSGDVTDEAAREEDGLALEVASEIGQEDVVHEARHGGGDDELVEAAARASAESEEVLDDGEAEPRSAPVIAVPPPPPPRAAAPASRRAPEPEREAGVDLSDEIEEAEFFLQQGLLDDARGALENLLAFYPEHPVVKRKLAELDSKAASPSRVDGVAKPAEAFDLGPEGADASFDIARELAELGGGAPAVDEEFQYSVEDVFNQFKKGVEQTVKPEDSATHYDLGIAYKEMGLLDDAIHEFETALQGNDKKKEVDCLSMIGLCQSAKGDGRAAIAAFRRALASDHLTRDAAKAIHYELAGAYEGTGDREVALHYFQRVLKADPAFRDAAKRTQALGGGPGRPPADEPRARPAGPTARPVPPARPPAPPSGAAKKNIGYL